MTRWMRATRLALLSALAALPGTAVAQPTDAAPAMAEARAGNLQVVQLWTTEPDAVRATLGTQTFPAQHVARTAERNQPVQLFLLYANCQRDPDDHCWLRARMTITAPDGKPYGEPVVFDTVPLGPAPRGGINLAPNGVTLIIEDGEQLGSYRIEMAVTDEIAVQTAVSAVQLVVVEAASPAAPSGK